MSRNTKSVAARIDADSVAKIERAARYRGETKSAFLAAIIEDHIDRNPFDIPAFGDRSIADGVRNAGSESTEQPRSIIGQMFPDLE